MKTVAPRSCWTRALTFLVVAGISASVVAQTTDLTVDGEQGPSGTRNKLAPPLGATAAGISTTARINNRISNRIESRIRNRIDRFYNPQANALAPFKVDGANTRDAIRTTPKRR